jgi:hypothetical protein
MPEYTIVGAWNMKSRFFVHRLAIELRAVDRVVCLDDLAGGVGEDRYLPLCESSHGSRQEARIFREMSSHAGTE